MISSRGETCRDRRRQLDALFLTDANLSMAFGVVALFAPHRMIIYFSSFNNYSHGFHEVLRLYACLRIAVGWMLFHVRRVDDGCFRRSICEAMCACHALQAVSVIRAQFTDRYTVVNWFAMILFLVLGGMYGLFRFGEGGHMIKVYELPHASVRAAL